MKNDKPVINLALTIKQAKDLESYLDSIVDSGTNCSMLEGTLIKLQKQIAIVGDT